MAYTKCDPNMGRLVEALRHVGYEPDQAVADLVDNSVDANAGTVEVSIVSSKDGISIRIADDGDGMDGATLIEAVRLGSKTDRDQASDLGRFGMGLVTASLSIGRRFSVLTKRKGGPAYQARVDVDTIVKRNEYVAENVSEVATEDWSVAAGERKTGTVLVIDKIDGIENQDIETIANGVANKLAWSHRRMLLAEDVSIAVNGKAVVGIDYLYLNDQRTALRLDEKLKLTWNGQEYPIGVRLVLLPEDPEVIQKTNGITIANSGFSVIRNGREIEHGTMLGLRTKAAEQSRFRGEIEFSGELDDAFGVSFTKQGVRLREALKGKLKQELGPVLDGMMREIRSQWQSRKSKEQGVTHDSVQTIVRQRIKQLVTPTAPKPEEKIEKIKGRADKKRKPRVDDGKPTNPRERAEFREAALGASGIVYDCTQEGRKIIVILNTDHAFYREVYLKAASEDVRFAIDCLIYSLAAAELTLGSRDEKEAGTVEMLRLIASGNLSALLR